MHVRRFLFFMVFLAVSSGASGQVLHPERLQVALEQYTQIALNGAWPTVPEGPTIRPGSNDSRTTLLADRLRASGDLGDSTREFLTYDEALRTAVTRFQARHGLEPDGLVGKRTLYALNVPIEDRIRQIRLNLDRIADLDIEPPESLLLINIPAFRLTLLRSGEPEWRGRVIVGEASTETPQFEARVTHVVLNPDWTVPRKIATEEILPKVQRDTEFLRRGGYEIFDIDGAPLDAASIDWHALNRNNFPLTIVQRPGPLNELGRVKFMFPNEHGVCMHDTPQKHLFARSLRDFSHGCVRLQNPLDLATEVLAAEGWTPEDIGRQIESGNTATILLSEPLRVVLTYLTVEVSADGTVYFFPDIYGRDSI